MITMVSSTENTSYMLRERQQENLDPNQTSIEQDVKPRLES